MKIWEGGAGWCVAMAAASPPNFPSSSWPAIKLPGADLPIDTDGSSCDLSRIYLRAALESITPSE